MCVDDTKSDVMKAIHDGACDYWIKPLKENLIQNMWDLATCCKENVD
jgi:response regulator of citrate/malate metabolism